MNTITLLRQLSILADETAEALHSGGVETLVLKTFTEAATPIWIQIQIAAKTANTPLAPVIAKPATAAKPQPTGRFSGAPAPAPQKTMSTPPPAGKSAPQAKPEAKDTGTVVSIPASKTVTLNPPRRRKPAGM